MNNFLLSFTFSFTCVNMVSWFPVFFFLVWVVNCWYHYLSRNLNFVSGKGYLETKVWTRVHFSLGYHRRSRRTELDDICTLAQINTHVHIYASSRSSISIALYLCTLKTINQFQCNTTSLLRPSLLPPLLLPFLALSLVLLSAVYLSAQYWVHVSSSFKSANLYPCGRQNN